MSGLSEAINRLVLAATYLTREQVLVLVDVAVGLRNDSPIVEAGRDSVDLWVHDEPTGG